MLQAFIREYKDGVVDSIQGFLVVHKLDRPPNNASSVEPRASSVEPHTKPTILEKRRMQQKKQEKKPIPPSVPIQGKVVAIKRVLCIAAINIAIVFLFVTLYTITEWLIPNKESGLYTFSSYFRTMLIMPIFIATRIISTLWFADVANAAFRYRGTISRSSTSIDISRAGKASDLLHSLLVELVFLIQAICLALIPELVLASPLISHIGWLASLVYMSLLHSLYSFEYMWISKGMLMNSRLSHVERHWPYHLGFGSLLTLLTSMHESFLLNSCIFGALFPFFIISSFLVDNDYPDTEVPQFAFFHPALTITNKISLTFFKFVSPEIKNR